jgi:hypothetical protein
VRGVVMRNRRYEELDHAGAARGTRAAAQTTAKGLAPVDAVQGIVAGFERHPIVLIGEDHWLRQAGDFYMRLARDPAFQATVQDFVVECASQNNRPLLDRYIAGEDVPIEDVRRIWRDTSKVAGWESPIYAESLAAIREVNKGLAPAHRFRVLAGDTGVDWSRIHNHSDWEALGDNNVSFANVVIAQVLARGSLALWSFWEASMWRSPEHAAEGTIQPRGSNPATLAPLTC